jgi:hypothetical protein
MNGDAMTWARARIAARQGRLAGWRPMIIGDTAIVALQVLGMAHGAPSTVGLNVVVAGRSETAIERSGPRAAEAALRKRAVLSDSDNFLVVRSGALHDGDGDSDDPLRWPWKTLLVHVPEEQLPAIAGLATDTVPTG